MIYFETRGCLVPRRRSLFERGARGVVGLLLALRLRTIKPRAPCFPARNGAWVRGRTRAEKWWNDQLYSTYREVDFLVSLLGVQAATLSNEDDKEMKSYMDQMDDELARTSIGESFEKVNIEFN